MKIKMSKLVEMVGDLYPNGSYTTEDYVRTLLDYAKGLPDIEEVDTDESYEEYVEINEEELNLLKEYIETFNAIHSMIDTEDDLPLEDIEDVEANHGFDECDIDLMNAYLEALQEKVEANQAPKGELLEDGWYEVNENLSVRCDDGKAAYGLWDDGLNQKRVFPYKYSKLAECLVNVTVWATKEDIQEAEWH